MIARHHTSGPTRSTALYSDCEGYRYALTRTWDPDAGRIVFVMLNPSKATEQVNDPTIARCERRSRALGYGAFQVVNIFAWRETSPGLLRRAPAPVGSDNDATLLQAADWGDLIVAAWGVHGVHQGRGPRVARMLQDAGHNLHALGLTQDGHPRHPLYVAYAQTPTPWSPARDAAR